MQLFGLKSHCEKLRIFANDKPNDRYNSTLAMDFEDVTVVESKPLPKGTFKLAQSQINSLERNGVAWFTPQAIKLFVGESF